MKKETNKKQALLDAFDLSKTKKVAEVCRLANVAKSSFYFHCNKDEDFRQAVLKKQLEHLKERIAAV
jgi:AcrR family transcriptional regulator